MDVPGQALPKAVRIEMQEGYLEEIHQTFDQLVRAIVPLYETEVRGVPMLERVGKNLFT